jgi:hypothetical protein
MNRRVTLPIFLAALLIGVGCRDTTGPSPLVPSVPSAVISDGAHGGNPHFFFLPPMVPNPSFSGTFDAALSPLVEICETPACLAMHVTFTMTTGPGSETIRVSPTDGHYIVNWHTNHTGAVVGNTYRIRVRVGDLVLGFADIQIASNGQQARNVTNNQTIGLVGGRTLPIKFRIETGVVARIEVSPSQATIGVGGDQQFTATLYNLHNQVIPDGTVVWSSSDNGIASLDQTGLATGHAVGSVTITASSKGTSGTASLTVTAVAPPEGPTATITAPTPGGEFAHTTVITFTGSAVDAFGTPITGGDLRWFSSRQGEIGTGGSFTRTLEPGLHVIRLVATDSNGQTGEATVTIGVLPPPITSDINIPTVLPYIGVPYTVTGGITVQSPLTIEPGVELRFGGPCAGIRIAGSAVLLAIGTSEAPIRFTSPLAVPGSWDGIVFEATTTGSMLTYVEVEYAGQGNPNCVSRGIKGNVILGASPILPGRVTMTHSTLRQSGGYGLWISDNSTLEGFAQNRFEGNLDAPVRLPDAEIGSLDSSSDYSGASAPNGRQYIEVHRRGAGYVGAHTWRRLDVPYRFVSGTEIGSATTLTIEPGAILQFTTGTGLRVQAGVLHAIGTAAEKIIFTGVTAAPGAWEGLVFHASGSTSPSELTHVEVAYAGAGTVGSISNGIKGNVILGASPSLPGRVMMTHSTIRHSGGYGLWISNISTLHGFTENRFEGNLDAPVRLPANVIGSLDGSSVYSGAGGAPNGRQYIEVHTQTAGVPSQTWPRTDVPYRFLGAQTIGSVVTIQAGANFQFTAGTGLLIQGGALRAIGTAAEKIMFSGVTASPGSWEGLVFNTPGSAGQSELTHVEVAYGGAGTASFANGIKGNIIVGTSAILPGNLRLTNSLIRDSDGWGVYVNAGTFVQTDNTYVSNALGDVRLP